MENNIPNNESKKQEFIQQMRDELMLQQDLIDIETMAKEEQFSAITKVLKSQPLQKYYLGPESVFNSAEEAAEYVEKLGVLNEVMNLQSSSVRGQKDALMRKKLATLAIIGNAAQQQELRASLPQWEKVRSMPTLTENAVKNLDKIDEKSNKEEERDEEDLQNQAQDQAKVQAEEMNRQRLMEEERRREEENTYAFSMKKNKKKGFSLATKVMTGATVLGTGAVAGMSMFPLLFKGLS